MSIPKFKESHLDRLARALAEAVSHRELTRLFEQCGIEGNSEGPRWHRILCALSARQAQDGVGSHVGAFIQEALDPARFQDPKLHQSVLEEVNLVLAFNGLNVDDAGKLQPTRPAATLSEAAIRAKRLRQNLVARQVHEKVLRFCTEELVVDNYFHAVLEATKSVADTIRLRTSLPCDGTLLADRAFGGKQPLLALSKLETETERSEQGGFVNLLKGFFGTFRNPTAHAPKVAWSISEQDALDLLTMASYLHRRVDIAVRTPWH